MLAKPLAAFGLTAVVVVAMSPAAFAHGDQAKGSGIGAPGEASAVERDITVIMTDNEYDPSVIEVRAGETIRFKVKNAGELVHEFNIGTAAMHEKHQAEMMMMLEHGVLEADRINHDMMGQHGMMSHDDPNAVLLEPGQEAEIIWTFDDAHDLQFGCNVPGHYEAGMVGDFKAM